ncbi:hypothetical protein [Brasilonema bromeliae]|uniref:Uncharacterized protein n=1 Tax=Brasilonema bromeliae SPC951 TaxID=385972 RepID=A0ABX1P8F4_9CYAN|nr:hypothetical protein [Brasilonema bromeliae]NMG20712.1 hypothetical protein [Brasilonema bromeliae SPC951]
MFSKAQFEFLTAVQLVDDWHCSCFVDVLRQYHENDLNRYATSVRLKQEEFDELMTILSRADDEDIFQLQFALNALNLLPCSMFESATE